MQNNCVKGAVSAIGLRSPALDFSLTFESRPLCVSPHLLLFFKFNFIHDIALVR